MSVDAITTNAGTVHCAACYTATALQATRSFAALLSCTATTTLEVVVDQPLPTLPPSTPEVQQALASSALLLTVNSIDVVNSRAYTSG